MILHAAKAKRSADDFMANNFDSFLKEEQNEFEERQFIPRNRKIDIEKEWAKANPIAWTKERIAGRG